MDVAFITGATGFVGAHLARLLVSKGLRVRALARPGGDRSNLRGVPLEIVEGDLASPEVLREGMRGCRYVFHAAADYRIWAPDPRPLYKTNVDGTVNVLTAALQSRVERVVHCSSVAAVKPPDGARPADETSAYAGVDDVVSDYKKSKYLAERAALGFAARGLAVVVVNPSTPVGPYDIKPTPTGKIILDFLNGRMPSYVDTGLNLVDVRDVAEGHWLAALRGRPGQRYILGGDNVTLKEMLDSLAAVTGLPPPRFKTPYAVAYAFGFLDTARARLLGGEPIAPLDAVRMARHYMWFDSAKARLELGYAPAPPRRALEDAVSYFKAGGRARSRAPA